jgi:hypothetical protein
MLSGQKFIPAFFIYCGKDANDESSANHYCLQIPKPQTLENALKIHLKIDRNDSHLGR